MIGLIIQPGRYPKTSWCQIDHLRYFYPFSTLSPSRYGIPLVTLDDCWARIIFFKFDVFKTPSEAGYLITLETGDPSMARLSCTWGSEWSDVIVLLFFYGAMLGLWLGIYLGYSSISGVNQVYLMWMLSGVLLCKLRCTRSFQFGVIVTYLMNGNLENS